MKDAFQSVTISAAAYYGADLCEAGKITHVMDRKKRDIMAVPVWKIRRVCYSNDESRTFLIDSDDGHSMTQFETDLGKHLKDFRIRRMTKKEVESLFPFVEHY